MRVRITTQRFLIACFGLMSVPVSSKAALRGESPTVIGDARQIGVSGASLASPDSVHTAMENPANAYFEEWVATLALLNSKVRDNRMNGDGVYRRSEGIGLAASSPRFGLFVGHRTPSQEFSLAGRVEVQETHLGGAFPIGNLTVGAAVISARTDWTGFNQPQIHESAWSVSFGTRYRFSDRVQLGLSVRPSVPIQRRGDTSYRGLLEIPARIMLGGSIFITPEFQLHSAITIFGQQDDTVSLADPNRPAARSISTQPRLGLEYKIYEKGIVSLSSYAGTYLEPGRLDGVSTRFHYTGGAGLKVWAGRAAFAFDRASGYKNVIATVGIDVLDLLVKVKVIPVPESARPQPAAEPNQ